MILVAAYYGFWLGVVVMLLTHFPGLSAYFPTGGIGELAATASTEFEPVYTAVEENVLSLGSAIKLLFASFGAAVLIVPVSWVYFITSRIRQVDQSFVQAVMLLPIVVTGISMIVMNSLALAFSLAGIVAAVRFRFTLDQPSHAIYIFVAISIGLGSGIGALGVSMVISLAFVVASLVIWKLEYGRSLSGPFFSMLTRRSRTGGDE